LTNQKDYEHYTAEGFDSKFSYLKKYMLSDMGVLAGQVKTPMGNFSQRGLFAADERCHKGNAVNVT